MSCGNPTREKAQWPRHVGEVQRHSHPSPGGLGPCYLGGGAQDRGQGVPLQEVRQLGRAAQGPAGLKSVGGLGGAGLRVAERHPQWVRGGLGQLGTDDVQVRQVGGAVQAAAQPGGVGRVLRRGGAWEGTGWAQSQPSADARTRPHHQPIVYGGPQPAQDPLYPQSPEPHCTLAPLCTLGNRHRDTETPAQDHTA